MMTEMMNEALRIKSEKEAQALMLICIESLKLLEPAEVTISNCSVNGKETKDKVVLSKKTVNDIWRALLESAKQSILEVAASKAPRTLQCPSCGRIIFEGQMYPCNGTPAQLQCGARQMLASQLNEGA